MTHEPRNPMPPRSTLVAAEPLFLEFNAVDATFAQPLRAEPWGARTFIIRDPDGNLILFVGPGE